jgi:hypothetical protein
MDLPAFLHVQLRNAHAKLSTKPHRHSLHARHTHSANLEEFETPLKRWISNALKARVRCQRTRMIYCTALRLHTATALPPRKRRYQSLEAPCGCRLNTHDTLIDITPLYLILPLPELSSSLVPTSAQPQRSRQPSKQLNCTRRDRGYIWSIAAIYDQTTSWCSAVTAEFELLKRLPDSQVLQRIH